MTHFSDHSVKLFFSKGSSCGCRAIAQEVTALSSSVVFGLWCSGQAPCTEGALWASVLLCLPSLGWRQRDAVHYGSWARGFPRWKHVRAKLCCSVGCRAGGWAEVLNHIPYLCILCLLPWCCQDIQQFHSLDCASDGGKNLLSPVFAVCFIWGGVNLYSVHLFTSGFNGVIRSLQI